MVVVDQEKVQKAEMAESEYRNNPPNNPPSDDQQKAKREFQIARLFENAGAKERAEEWYIEAAQHGHKSAQAVLTDRGLWMHPSIKN